MSGFPSSNVGLALIGAAAWHIVPAGPASTTLDPANKNTNIALSGGNLVGTASTVGVARATNSKTTGKWYFEMRANPNSSPGCGIGIANSSCDVSAATGLGLDSNHSHCAYNNNEAFLNGNALGNWYSSFTANDYWACAVDLDAQKIWYRDITASSNWNTSQAGGAADPASGTGGFSFAAMGSAGIAIWPAASFFSSGGVDTMNFGATSFQGVIPSSFSAWG